MDYAVDRRNPLRQAVKQALVRALPRRYFVATRLPDPRALFLTFDDGPHPEHTPQLLDRLAEQEATATFFVIGQHAEKHPELLKRIVDEGHALGHHSYYHTEPSRTSARQLAAESQRCIELLRDASGVEPILFRPPHGKVTGGKLLRLAAQRQAVVLWNVDPKDYAAPDANAVAKWFEENPVRGGDVVLMHDNHPHASGAILRLLETTRAQGLRARAIRPEDLS